MAKYSVPDDHWEEDDDEPDPDSPASIQSHEVDVILTTDPTEKYGYGREKYTVHVGHDFDDSPVAVFATEYRWKGNYWRDVKQIDWHDVPGAVKQAVAHVVDCDGVTDLHPGHRTVGEGGESTWRTDDDAESETCPSCGYAPGDASFSTAPGQCVCPNPNCSVVSWKTDADVDGGNA